MHTSINLWCLFCADGDRREREKERKRLCALVRVRKNYEAQKINYISEQFIFVGTMHVGFLGGLRAASVERVR
jgi:hypothetical protein